MNKRKLAVQYFACLVLAVLVLFYSSFSQPYHISIYVRHLGLLRRPRTLPGALFLRFVLSWLRRCGVDFPWEISIDIGAWTTCIFVQTCCLAKFREFSLFWWLLCVSHPVIHNSLWHRRLACTYRGIQRAFFFFTRESKIVEGVKIELQTPSTIFDSLVKKKNALHCPINSARLHRDYQKKKTKSFPVRRKDHLLWLISICMVLELCERSLITLRTKT